MRSVLVTVLVFALAGVTSADIPTPGEYRYLDAIMVGDPDTLVWVTVDLESVQDGIDLAESFFTHPLVDLIPELEDQGIDTGHSDTVLAKVGTHDTVQFFETSVGRRSAVCRMLNGVTLTGSDLGVTLIDHSDAEYGIICEDVGPDTRIEGLSITGGIGRDQGRVADGDGRNLVAGIACLEGADPTISGVYIWGSATGIVIRGTSAPLIEWTVIARGSHHGMYIAKSGGAEVVADHVTVVQNFDHGIYAYGGQVSITNSCLTHNGKSGVRDYLGEPIVGYCNVYWNDQIDPNPETGPLNYSGMEDQTGTNGNISEEPFYCDFTGAAGYDYHVCVDSPNVGADSTGGDIGGLGGACTECASVVEATTWGAIKALYR